MRSAFSSRASTAARGNARNGRSCGSVAEVILIGRSIFVAAVPVTLVERYAAPLRRARRALRGVLVIHTVLEAIQSSQLSQLLTSTRWVATANSKQILETLHFTAFALQIGAIMVVSLRLVGLGRGVSIAALCRPALRTAWIAFAAVVVTGTLQFIPIATEVFYRPSFRAKIALLSLALAMLGWLHLQLRNGALEWDSGNAMPFSVRFMAGLSLVLWPTVIVVARLMYAFVQMASP
jgi:hypothetical protein